MGIEKLSSDKAEESNRASVERANLGLKAKELKEQLGMVEGRISSLNAKYKNLSENDVKKAEFERFIAEGLEIIRDINDRLNVLSAKMDDKLAEHHENLAEFIEGERDKK